MNHQQGEASLMNKINPIPPALDDGIDHTSSAGYRSGLVQDIVLYCSKLKIEPWHCSHIQCWVWEPWHYCKQCAHNTVKVMHLGSEVGTRYILQYLSE